jgi:hypothetical protein
MMTFEEIGAKLQIPAGTVYADYRRGMAKLCLRPRSIARMRDIAKALERDRVLRLNGMNRLARGSSGRAAKLGPG